MNILSKLFNKRKADKILCSAIIVAAGKGNRMNSEGKMFSQIDEMPIIFYAIREFEECKEVNEVIVVMREEDIVSCMDLINEFEFKKVKKIIKGGEERSDSVLNGLKEVSKNSNIIAIHDGARPLITKEYITKTIYATKEHKAVTLGVRVKDTIKVVDEEKNIIDTPSRNSLWEVHTPQVFERDIIIKAYESFINNKEISKNITDDCMLVEKLGYKVKMIEGSYENIKITTPEDLIIAEAILRFREEGE